MASIVLLTEAIASLKTIGVYALVVVLLVITALAIVLSVSGGVSVYLKKLARMFLHSSELTR